LPKPGNSFARQLVSRLPGALLNFFLSASPFIRGRLEKSTRPLPEGGPNEIFCSSDSSKEHNWNPEAGDTVKADWPNAST
jgi:hypothetical protein